MDARFGCLTLTATSLLLVGFGFDHAASAAPAESTVVSFTDVGAASFSVPDGVTCATIDAVGARGGSAVQGDQSATGGLGGRTHATLQLTPGETLQLNIGGAGGDSNAQSLAAGAGGANGGAPGGSGGTGAAGGSGGAGGGGASDVRRAGTELADRVIVAGGGGGGGAGFPTFNGGPGGAGGGEKGASGTNGAGVSGPVGQSPPPDPNGGAVGGGGGTQTSGGAGPAGGGAFGQAGTGGVGDSPGGGGGGGGLFGGGGGGASFSKVSVGEVVFFTGAAGGGGGGSGFAAPSTMNAASTNGTDAGNAGNGKITITFTVGDTSCLPASATTPRTQQLARTGRDTQHLAVLACGLVAAGLVLDGCSKRTSASHTHHT